MKAYHQLVKVWSIPLWLKRNHLCGWLWGMKSYFGDHKLVVTLNQNVYSTTTVPLFQQLPAGYYIPNQSWLRLFIAMLNYVAILVDIVTQFWLKALAQRNTVIVMCVRGHWGYETADVLAKKDVQSRFIGRETFYGLVKNYLRTHLCITLEHRSKNITLVYDFKCKTIKYFFEYWGLDLNKRGFSIITGLCTVFWGIISRKSVQYF